MAKKELTKEQQWFDEIILESFRSDKKMYEYMKSRTEEKWHKVEKFSERAILVFGECAIEDDVFYENCKGQYIDPEHKRLYSISLEEFAEQFNFPDCNSYPILINYFKSYENTPDKITQLLAAAYNALKIPEVKGKADLKPLNIWVKNQIMEQRTPEFYDEEIYAYLIVIVGELLRNTKLVNSHWQVLKTDIRNPDQDTPVDYIYIPYLVDKSGIMYDIVQSFRENLFLSGGANFLISKVFNNVQEKSIHPRWC